MSTLIALALVAVFATPTVVDGPSAHSLTLAREIGLTPMALVASGVSPSTAASVLDTIGIDSEVGPLLLARRIEASALVEEATALAALLATQAADVIVDDYLAACAALDVIRSELATLGDQLFAVALAELASGQIATLTAWRSNGERAVPPEFRVTPRDDIAWATIEAALRAESRAARKDAELDGAHASVLQGVRSEAPVIAAQIAIPAGITAMSTVFGEE